MNDGKSAKPEQPVPEPASKDMTWTDGKQTIKYTATAEMLPLHTDDGTLIGHMFALSYVSDAADKSDRPATFCWNGGPGGSSAMVNIGGSGPRRVPINTIKQLPCPYEARGQSLLASAHDRPGVPGRHGHRRPRSAGRGLRPEEGLGRRRRR